MVSYSTGQGVNHHAHRLGRSLRHRFTREKDRPAVGVAPPVSLTFPKAQHNRREVIMKTQPKAHLS